jgi:TonB family protein
MSSILSLVASYLINSIWEVSLIAGAGWLVSRAFKKLGPQAQHVVWVSTLFLAVITPALPVLRSLSTVVHIPHRMAQYASITIVAGQSSQTHPPNTYPLPTVIVVALLALYFSSMLYFATRLTWSVHCTTRLFRETLPASLTPEQGEIWHLCRQSFSLGTARILSSSRISGPATLGFLKPVLLLPVGFAAGCMPQDLLAALAHECAHIKRHDFKKNLFYEATSLVLAFHPVIWILKSNITQTREMVCDDMATEKLIDPPSYSQSLLRLASMIALRARVSTSHAIGIFDANILEKRIMMMNIRKQRPSSVFKYILTIPATLFLFSVAVSVSAMALVIIPQSTSQPGDQSKPFGTIYHVGKEVTAPHLIESQPPEYPESDRGGHDKFEGTCIINFIVDASGIPREVHVARSLRPDFDASAVKAVQKYRFTPATRSGEPVAVSLNVEVNFKKF